MKPIHQIGLLLLAILREIFDETAYGRYLQLTGQPSSPAAYRDFLRQKHGANPRPRCC